MFMLINYRSFSIKIYLYLSKKLFYCHLPSSANQLAVSSTSIVLAVFMVWIWILLLAAAVAYCDDYWIWIVIIFQRDVLIIWIFQGPAWCSGFVVFSILLYSDPDGDGFFKRERERKSEKYRRKREEERVTETIKKRDWNKEIKKKSKREGQRWKKNKERDR